MKDLLFNASEDNYSPGTFVDPGVVPVSPGAAGSISPALFSGVLDFTFVCPGPAVAGLSPFGPEGVTFASRSCCCVVAMGG